MKHNIELPEADFFQVYLRGHLVDHHFPQRNNKKFIETRSDDAYDTFVAARLEGKPEPVARELAMRTLLAGLYVSRYDILYNVVEENLWLRLPPEYILNWLRSTMRSPIIERQRMSVLTVRTSTRYSTISRPPRHRRNLYRN